MTQHTLQGRTEDEILWFRRRGFLQAAAAWTTMGGFATAHAQHRSNVVELFGDATLNGNRLTGDSVIQTGDLVRTGPGSSLVFVIGNAAFLVRQNSHMTVERGRTLDTVSLLRVLTGAVPACGARARRAASSRPRSPPASAAPACTPRSSPNRRCAPISATATAWSR